VVVEGTSVVVVVVEEGTGVVVVVEDTVVEETVEEDEVDADPNRNTLRRSPAPHFSRAFPGQLKLQS